MEHRVKIKLGELEKRKSNSVCMQMARQGRGDATSKVLCVTIHTLPSVDVAVYPGNKAKVIDSLFPRFLNRGAYLYIYLSRSLRP